ncbi:hypothetical protein K503DRAFT_736352 [Rhizopogon vinicolor AM-OR11-026]|uniref:Cyclin N-terminal domain-containing protein n=1 Tax=Rhizopogon vinicolor AM-OR11-026 TaxID=1314800 RepID=A0A1B7N870_9AGAM|nr:hypothetical protein K503DRAFT_736352 [Rhizopogon vinicolor AM-OR11-026]
MVRPAAHSLAHRGPPATTSHSHTRVRWQPYHAALSSISSRPSPSYLITPASSVSSISPSPLSVYESERPRIPQFQPRESQLRDPQKSKYVSGLVDQAVKSICEIWHPQDIPSVFLTCSRPTVPSASASAPTDIPIPSLSNPSFYGRNTQLPSPISPTTQPSPTPTPCMQNSHSLCSPEMRLTRVSGDQTPRCDVAPMKGFVHEVLRRSRTSGSVLQTALCYLEAIRAKVPELVTQEKEHPGSTYQKESVDRIVKGEVGADSANFDGSRSSSDTPAGNGLLDTVRINPISFEVDSSFLEPGVNADKVSLHKPKPGSASLAPLPPLPSPLLCPRRTFLASLILASKFMQDRCYSNRAWAKLSGLPPREIGRCERALGEALEWRLWVGKLPAAPAAPRRVISKCKSESNILYDPRMQSVMETSSDIFSPPGTAGSPLVPRSHVGLRRHATLPVHAFYPEDTYSAPIPAAVETSIWMPTARSMDHSPTNSISPPTPGLSYSPTPTESSLGDRTVQMSSFMDISTPPPPPCQFAAFASAQNDKMLPQASIPFLYSMPNDACQTHDQPFYAAGLSSSNNGSWSSLYAF